jgi:hypothetical protein
MTTTASNCGAKWRKFSVLRKHEDLTMRDSSLPVRRAMTGLAGSALVAFFSALVLFHRPPPGGPSVVHVIMAIGVMPLIMGAMIYFTPVLTRSRAPSWPVLAIPLLALIAGSMATMCLQWRRDWLPFPAFLIISITGVLLGWMWHRGQSAPGRPHPGLYWYVAALVCLLFGMTAILVATFRPEYWTALKRFHLHVNLLGFVGLSAVGTLHVLAPTVAGYPGDEARIRLWRDLYPAAAGVLLIAAGSAGWTWLVWPGFVLWFIILARLAWPLATRRRKFVWGWHRTGTSLAGAVFGLMLVTISGGLHSTGTWPAATSEPLFFFMFLFPLVTGAVGYLLPVWLWPARNVPAYENASRRFARGSGVRTLIFVTAGIMAWAGMAGAFYPAILAIAVFICQGVWAIWPRFSSEI